MSSLILSLEPIKNNLLTIALLYTLYTATGFTTGIATLYMLRGIGFDIKCKNFDLETLFLRSPIVALIKIFGIVAAEETIFRGIPIFLISSFFSLDLLSFRGIIILMLFHCTWAILHIFNEEDKISSVPNAVFVFVQGFFFLRLWIGELYYYAIVIHYMHDLVVISLVALHMKQD